MRILPLALLVLAGGAGVAAAAPREAPFEDPMFRRCIAWMLDGNRGGLIENICRDEYDLPPPSFFLCARKIRTGFASQNDREGCAILFDDSAKRIREGYIR
jgi:hypothetical protein